MMETKSTGIERNGSVRKTDQDFEDLSSWILHSANQTVPRIDFLGEAARVFIDFSGCDMIRLRLRDEDTYSQFEARRDPEGEIRFETVPASVHDPWLEKLCARLLEGRFDSSSTCMTNKGSYWTGDGDRSGKADSETPAHPPALPSGAGGEYRSFALIPLSIGDETMGLLLLKSRRYDFFTESDVERYEAVAQNLGVALVHQRAQAALRERVKELTCLYGIARVIERPGLSFQQRLQGIVAHIPPAWQFPEITCGRITLDGTTYSTPGLGEGRQKQTADIVIGGETRGSVEVVYAEEKPDLDEGPFLKEERSLVDSIAREVGLFIERRQAEEDREKLQEQLRHADRLATIGQLAAGVAHELNEPLGNILGFAQLAAKHPGLSDPVGQDIDKIVKASLHAREVIRKLMVFARQAPPKVTQVNLGQLVEDGLYFLESRCATAGIELIRSLSTDLREIVADPSQLHQALVNLVVNAIQAMPRGGRLTVRTDRGDGAVLLSVEDTGIGMSEAVRKQIFIPFFTTKDVNQGTGLGLSVVHGIVTAHGGRIQVESEIGKGSRFEIRLPLPDSGKEEERG